MTIQEMIGVGTTLINTFGTKARKEDWDNPALSFMAVALLDTVERATPADEKPLRLAVGYAMLGAFLYGQQAGAKLERSRLAPLFCYHCARIAGGDREFTSAHRLLTDGGVSQWLHEKDTTTVECQASTIWESAHEVPERENEFERRETK